MLPTDKSLIDINIATLNEGSELLSRFEPDHYTGGVKPAFHSTIGEHFRHVLEHYRCFFLHMESGKFCYDSRARDQRLQVNIAYAVRTIAEVSVLFGTLKQADFTQEYTIIDPQTENEAKTSLQRELLFLQSHTVHHYAIIGAMSRSLGVQPKDDFGVAIATRVYNHGLIKTQEKSSCAH